MCLRVCVGGKGVNCEAPSVVGAQVQVQVHVHAH